MYLESDILVFNSDFDLTENSIGLIYFNTFLIKLKDMKKKENKRFCFHRYLNYVLNH